MTEVSTAPSGYAFSEGTAATDYTCGGTILSRSEYGDSYASDSQDDQPSYQVSNLTMHLTVSVPAHINSEHFANDALHLCFVIE